MTSYYAAIYTSSLSPSAPITMHYNLCSNHWVICFSLNSSVMFPSLVSTGLILFPSLIHIRNDIPMYNNTTHTILSRF